MTTAPPRAARPTRTPGLYVLAVAVFAVITTEVVPVGILPQVADSFSTTESTAGLLVTLYAGLVALGAIPLTLFTNHLPRKPVLLSTLVAFTASNVLATFAPSFAWLVVARALGGLAHALFFAISIGYASRIAPAGRVGHAMALVAVGGSAGFILGVPAGTALASVAGWRVTFGALAVLVLGALLASLRWLPSVQHTVSGSSALVPGGGKMLAIVWLSGLCFLGHYTVYTYVSPLLLAAGLPAVWLSPALVLFGVTGLVAIRVAGSRLDSHPWRWMILVPAVLTVGLVLVAVTQGTLWLLLVVASVWIAAFGPVGSTYQATLVKVGRSNPEMAGAWINLTSNVGIGGGSALGGAVLSVAGYAALGWVGAAVLVVALALTLVFSRKLRAVVSSADGTESTKRYNQPQDSSDVGLGVTTAAERNTVQDAERLAA